MRSKSTIQRNRILLHFFVLASLLLCIIIGTVIDINVVVIILFGLFIITVFTRESMFFVKHIYYIANAILLIIGVWVCDSSNVNLYEINKTSHYTNALSLMVLSKVLFFIAVFYCYAKRRKKTGLIHIDNKVSSNIGSKIASIMIWAFIILEMYSCVVLYQIGSNSMLGLSRFGYMEVIPSLVKSVQGYILPMLAILLLSKGKYKKMQSIVFTVCSMFILLWTGQKFGSYFALVNLLVIGANIKEETIRKNKKRIILVSAIVAFALLGIAFLQYFLLFHYSFSQYTEYLYARLAQQGQVWWSVFDQTKNELPKFGSFADEIVGCVNQSKILTYPYLGQWKMMDIASNGLTGIRYRIQIGLPLTSTTEASIFYYFGHLGIIVISPILGAIYAFVFTELERAIRSRKILNTFIYTKIFVYITYLTGASDIQSILGIKGLVYIIAAIALELSRIKAISLFKKSRYSSD